MPYRCSKDNAQDDMTVRDRQGNNSRYNQPSQVSTKLSTKARGMVFKATSGGPPKVSSPSFTSSYLIFYARPP